MKKKVIFSIFALLFYEYFSFNVVFAEGNYQSHVCENFELLKVIYFIIILIDIVKIVIPILLIILGMIDFSKSVINNDQKVQKKNISLFIKRIIYAILIFTVPWIVKLVIINLGDLAGNVNFTDCFDNANEEQIMKFQKQEKAEEEKQEEIRKLEIEQTQKRTESDKENKEISSNNERDDVTSSSSGTIKFEHLDSGTAGNYFSPIQGVNEYKILSAGSTPGCSGIVYHDMTQVPVGTPIYAGIDGSAEFIQAYITSGSQKNRLYSYGNHIRLTSNDGKTLIIYAHLQKFADGINAPIKETCAKKSNGGLPCSATSYSGTKKTVATYNVKKGDLIGYLGDTGNSVVPHLHVEIRKNSICVKDPYEEFGLEH